MSARRQSVYSEAEVQARFREIYELKLQVVTLQQKLEIQSKSMDAMEATNKSLTSQLEMAHEDIKKTKKEMEALERLKNEMKSLQTNGTESPADAVGSEALPSFNQSLGASMRLLTSAGDSGQKQQDASSKKENISSALGITSDSSISQETKSKTSRLTNVDSNSVTSETTADEYLQPSKPANILMDMDHEELAKLASNLKDQLEDLTLSLRATNEELDEMKQKLEQSRDDVQILQTTQLKSEKTIIQLENKIDDLNSTIKSLKHERESLTQILESTAQDGKATLTMKEEVSRSRVIIDQLKKHITALTADANKKYGELQNQVETGKMFIEQLKQEYEEFVKVSMEEQETLRRFYMQEYNRLRDEFDAFKRTQFEEKRHLIHEQQALLFAMQTQFDEYRMTAEFLFNIEASKLEEKLNIQMLKYDQEIRFIIRSKDRLFDEMIAAKDVKIMMLIEGSDTQVLTQKHLLEIEALRKSHHRDMQEMKKQHTRDLQVSLGQMNQELIALQKTIETLKLSLANNEKRAEEMREKLGAKNKKIHHLELSLNETQSRLLKQIDTMQAKYDVIVQEKEQLRHRMIRMKTDRITIGDTSVESLVKQLTQEVSRLTTECNRLTNKCESLEEEKEDMAKKEQANRHQLILTEHRFDTCKQEMQRMSDAFEAMVNAKLRRFAQTDDLHGSTANRMPTLPKPNGKEKGWVTEMNLSIGSKGLHNGAANVESPHPAPPAFPSGLPSKSPRVRAAVTSAPLNHSKNTTADDDFHEELTTAIE